MDPKTKQLVERAEGLLLSEDDADRPDDDFVKALCSAVREQDKRARHAEAERDAFDERIKELEKQKREVVQACLGRDVKDTLASQVLGLWKSQSKLIEYAAELESERDGLTREVEAKATMIANLIVKCERLEVELELVHMEQMKVKYIGDDYRPLTLTIPRMWFSF